ncbi:MAG: hypothetical protein WAW03_06110 [Anaerolineae bacterium]|uniref:hypothetical protein n=2 Tax=Candidatus Amarolinea dominans TaxID=3140696 RepID=UPI003135B307|nr:hypothetical protein [Anaerolineae bacterium]MBK9095481.1 hypothetical protein [Anaerolineae bacterium]
MQRVKRRVLLICSHHLFGESLETILRRVDDMELLGPMELSQENIHARLFELRPDAVIVVDEGENRMNVSSLTSAILQQFPSLPVISAGLEQNIFRVFSAHTLPARSSDFVEAILNLPPSNPWEAAQPGFQPKPKPKP